MFPELMGMFGQSCAESRRDHGASQPFGGDTNPVTGVAAALLGSLGLLMGLATLFGLLAAQELRFSFAGVAVIAVVVLGCSYAGFYFGRLAPQVTSRHLGLAKFGMLAAVAGMMLSAALIVIAAARLIL